MNREDKGFEHVGVEEGEESRPEVVSERGRQGRQRELEGQEKNVKEGKEEKKRNRKSKGQQESQWGNKEVRGGHLLGLRRGP